MVGSALPLTLILYQIFFNLSIPYLEFLVKTLKFSHTFEASSFASSSVDASIVKSSNVSRFANV